MSESEQPRRRFGTIVLLVALLVAGFAIAVAVMRGGRSGAIAPGFPATSAAENTDPLAALEARTKDKPDDGEAWSALASGYFESGRFDEAITAYDKALDLAPRQAALWSGRGEARVMASTHDPMPGAAASDFARAVALDPKDPRARYFLAVGQDLTGDHQGAIDAWLALLADTPPGAAWEADLRRTIEQAGKINKISVAAQLAAIRQIAPLAATAMPAVVGPSAEDIARASAMRPAEQREMAEGMVARLEEKLKANPANVDGWIMLIRSRVNLGELDKANAALAAAVTANPGSATKLREQAAALGVR
jgi:cytochrome c-type biogenesis protein CcmH